MTNKEIQELQARLDKLKGKQEPMHGGQLGQQFEEMGKSFQEVGKRIPHVKLGSGKSKSFEEDPLVAKFRKWTLIVLTIVIAGTAGILVVWRILARFF